MSICGACKFPLNVYKQFKALFAETTFPQLMISMEKIASIVITFVIRLTSVQYTTSGDHLTAYISQFYTVGIIGHRQDDSSP